MRATVTRIRWRQILETRSMSASCSRLTLIVVAIVFRTGKPAHARAIDWRLTPRARAAFSSPTSRT